MTKPTARSAAVDVLRRVEAEEVFAEDLLPDAASALPPRDRRLLTMLVYGAIRHRGTLDVLIETVARRPMDRVTPELHPILRVGVYQRVFLDRVPAYAIVSSTVDLAREAGKKAASFANAAMRALDRLVDGPEGGQVDAESRRHLPRPDGTVLRLKEDVFPPASDAPRRLASLFSLPQWLVDRWLRAFGAARTEAVCAAANAYPVVTVRANPARGDRDALALRLAAEGIESEPGALPESLRLKRPGDVTAPAAFREGAYFVQDEAAMRVSRLLEPARGERVLDACAGTGGKATHVEEIQGGDGLVIAADPDARQIARQRENLARLGCRTVRSVRADARRGPWRDGAFGAVLVDAPCTNTGVLARRPEARWRLRADDPERTARRQGELLEAASRAVAPGGRLAYATCSIEREENEDVVAAFARSREEFKLTRSELLLPEPGHSGGFCAVLRRNPATG